MIAPQHSGICTYLARLVGWLVGVLETYETLVFMHYQTLLNVCSCMFIVCTLKYLHNCIQQVYSMLGLRLLNNVEAFSLPCFPHFHL